MKDQRVGGGELEVEVFTAIAGLMLAAALVAAWRPVHRVTRIDPQKALRCD